MAIGQAAGWFSIRPVPGQHRLRLSLQRPDYAQLKPIMERVRTMFDLHANPVEIGRHLGRHPQLAPAVRRAPGLRLPGAWDGFEVAVRILVARDVGHVGTAAVMGTLAAMYGQPLVTADDRGITTLFPTAAALLTGYRSPNAIGGVEILVSHRARGVLRPSPIQLPPARLGRRGGSDPEGLYPWSSSSVSLKLGTNVSRK